MGGYANGQQYGNICENSEPFAYEGGFAVQRLIVDQIDQAFLYPGVPDYGGEVDYSAAPWVDWGPYLWANGESFRSDGLNWCGGQNDAKCNSSYDVREGDITNPSVYWGDYTHPTASGQTKVANLLLNFINETTGSPWVTPWIGK